MRRAEFSVPQSEIRKALDLPITYIVSTASPALRTFHNRMEDHKAEYFSREIPVFPGGGIVDTLEWSVGPIPARQPPCGGDLGASRVDQFVDSIHDTVEIAGTQSSSYEIECIVTWNFSDFLVSFYVDQNSVLLRLSDAWFITEE